MKVVRYKVRKVKGGKVVRKWSYKVQSKALDRVRRIIKRGARAVVRKQVRETFEYITADKWGRRTPQCPVGNTHAPVTTVFVHTSVTKQLSPEASKRAEKKQMRAVEAVAYGRGFCGGFSYGHGVFPSGRAYEGRGFGKAQAATTGYNERSESIVTVGNTDAFKPTEAQLDAIVKVIKKGQKRGTIAQQVDVRGHRDVTAKACPGAKFTEAMIAEIQRRVN